MQVVGFGLIDAEDDSKVQYELQQFYYYYLMKLSKKSEDDVKQKSGEAMAKGVLTDWTQFQVEQKEDKPKDEKKTQNLSIALIIILVLYCGLILAEELVKNS